MVDMARFAFNKKKVSEKLDKFIYNDFTDFYDLYTEIKEVYLDYREGLANGKYYSINKNNSFKHNRSKELILKKKIKDFFIQGRLLIHNFGKSQVIDDNEFVLNNFLIVKDKNFETNKLNCLNSPVGNSIEL
jgi:hypothetical protein